MVEHPATLAAVVMGFEFVAINGAIERFLTDGRNDDALALAYEAEKTIARCQAAVEVVRMECSGP